MTDFNINKKNAESIPLENIGKIDNREKVDIYAPTKKSGIEIKLSWKTFLFSGIILVAIFIILLISIKFLEISADKNFSKGYYQKAIPQYGFLLVLKPDNKDIMIRYADSLYLAPFNYDTQERICAFIDLYGIEEASYALKEKVKKFKAKLDYQVGGNYIDKAPLSDVVLRWDDDAFPLKVTIMGDKAEVSDAVKRAFAEWTYATNNFVSFVYVDDPEDANIRVNIMESATANCKGENCLYAAAKTAPDIRNGILRKMNMTLYKKNPSGQEYDSEHIYRIALHEIGHALGIMGHSDNPENIMYASGNSNSSENQRVISVQDLNTLSYLYLIVPNISSIPQHKINTTNKVHPNIILGSSNEVKRRDIEKALKYVEKAPNVALGYSDLGNAYAQSGFYNKALETYKKGFDLATTTEDKYLFVFNMAITCKKMGNKKKALEYAEYAKKLHPTEEVEQFIHDTKHPWSINKNKQ